eukprot:SAG22_NODE_1904_length_3336_cov_1.495521_2_plen_213_part_01
MSPAGECHAALLDVSSVERAQPNTTPLLSQWMYPFCATPLCALLRWPAHLFDYIEEKRVDPSDGSSYATLASFKEVYGDRAGDLWAEAGRMDAMPGPAVPPGSGVVAGAVVGVVVGVTAGALFSALWGWFYGPLWGAVAGHFAGLVVGRPGPPGEVRLMDGASLASLVRSASRDTQLSATALRVHHIQHLERQYANSRELVLPARLTGAAMQE